MTLTQIKESASFLSQRGFDKADIGIVLGTGLGSIIQHLKIEQEIAYQDIPHFPTSTVESHKGKLLLATYAGKRILIMQGRFHYYEGYSMQQIAFPVRVMKLLGIKQLLISNAAGAINLNFRKGELMLLEDHINLLPDNPLRGANEEELGSRFPDMSAPYDKGLNDKLKAIAKAAHVTLNSGVYVSVMGPNLETRAEYKFLKIIGADAVGMSTVPEVIAAVHLNLPCCAISVLTDECNPEHLVPVEIAEIIRIAGEAEKDLITLYLKLIEQI